MAEQTLSGIGYHGFWGLSASFDFTDLISSSSSSSSLPVDTMKKDTKLLPWNILLVTPGDIRHILTTVSRRRRHSQHPQQKMNFYIFEPALEILCRELALLHIIADIDIPIRQRANIFLEVFGNCKVQERTARYIELIGIQLRKLISSQEGLLSTLVDLSLLKYREKDGLEDVFKTYARSYAFDMGTLFDHRLRGYLADRYDTRLPAFDWDWHYSLLPSASIIHVRMYKDWREKGIAFEFGDQVYSEGNKTMMSFIEGMMKKGADKGLKKEIKGYWGDIVCSPFFSFGIDCDTPNQFAKDLFEIVNKVNNYMQST